MLPWLACISHHDDWTTTEVVALWVANSCGWTWVQWCSYDVSLCSTVRHIDIYVFIQLISETIYFQLLQLICMIACVILMFRGSSSTSTLRVWGQGFPKGADYQKHFVGHMYKYADFDIKPTYTVIHHYGNPWYLLYSFWINRVKVIKFSTYV